MVQRYAENFENTDQSNPDVVRDYANKATDVAQDTGKQAKSVVDSVINYTRANPAEAIVVAAGVALALGLMIGYPRRQTKQERMAREFERRVRRAYADVQGAYSDVQSDVSNSQSWDRLSQWAKANLPTSLR